MPELTDLTAILSLAAERGASDIVVTRGSPVALKLAGRWEPVGAAPLTAEGAKAIVYSGLSNDQIARLEKEWELDWSFELAKEARLRFRGNAFFQRGAVGAVLRLLPRDVPSPTDLGLPPALEARVHEPQGLILVTGPTGHGKTTTCAALVDAVNRTHRAHIVTIEDPIEYVHRNKSSIVEQREVGADTHSFAAALRRVLRQSPDVIMIGEMRDPETISAALTAAETGHLVLATLHTNDAAKAIDRIVDSYPPHQQGQIRSQLSLALSAIASQRLVPRADGKGRVLAMELLINTAAVANLIREGKIYHIYAVLETASKDGMITMDAALRRLVTEGRISLSDARLRMRNPGQLQAPETPGTAVREILDPTNRPPPPGSPEARGSRGAR
jgi:twitching motility protein PilT